MKKSSLLPFAVALALSGLLPEEAHAAQDPATLTDRAEQGDVNAMLQLGQAYLDGRGVPMDVPRAIQLLESVIARNGPQAAFAHTALAGHYERTMRSPDDKTRMFRHYRLAAGLGDTSAQSRLGALLLQSIGSQGLDAAQADALRKQALGLLEHAYANGRADAAMEIGSAYLYGRGVEKNQELATSWLTKAADAKHRVAAYTLGYQYLNAAKGQGYDAAKARHYLQIAADLHHQGAITTLAEAHLSGKHWEANPEAARQLAANGVSVGANGAQDVLDRANAVIKAKQDEQARIAAQAEAAKKAEQARIAAEAQAAKDAEQARIAAQAEAAKKAEDARIAAQAEAAKKAEDARIAAQAAAAERERIQQIERIAREAVAEEARRKEQQLAQQAARPQPVVATSRPAPTSQTLVSGSAGTIASVSTQALPSAQVRVTPPVPGQFVAQADGSHAERRIAHLSAENTRLTTEVTYLRTELADRDEKIATLNDNLDRASDRMNEIEQRLATLDAGGPSSGQRQAAAENKPATWNRTGLQYFRAGNYERAVREFERAARSGNVEAMNNLGMAHLQGKGVPRDPQAAMAYFRDAADKGHATAANNIGHIYENGLGVARDNARAQLWYRRATHLNAVMANAGPVDAGYRIVAH